MKTVSQGNVNRWFALCITHLLGTLHVAAQARPTCKEQKQLVCKQMPQYVLFVAAFWSGGIAAGSALAGYNGYIIDGLGTYSNLYNPTRISAACNGLVVFVDADHHAIRVMGDVSEHHEVRTIANTGTLYGYSDGPPEVAHFQDIFGLATTTSATADGDYFAFVFDYNSGLFSSTDPAVMPARLRRIAIKNAEWCKSVNCYDFETSTVWESNLPYVRANVGSLIPQAGADSTAFTSGTLYTPPTTVIMHPSLPIMFFFDGSVLRKFEFKSNYANVRTLETVAGTASGSSSSGPFEGTKLAKIVFDSPQDMEWGSSGDLIVICSTYIVAVEMDAVGTASAVVLLAGSPGTQSGVQDGAASSATLSSAKWIVNLKKLTNSGDEMFLIGGESTSPGPGTTRRQYGTLPSSKPRLLFSNDSGMFLETLYSANSIFGSESNAPALWSGTDVNFAATTDAVVQNDGISGTHSIYFTYSGFDQRLAASSSSTLRASSHQIVRWTKVGEGNTWQSAGQLPSAVTDFAVSHHSRMVIITGGKVGDSSMPTTLVQAIQFKEDFEIDAFKVFPSLQFARYGHSSIVVDFNGNARVCVVGGLTLAVNAFGQNSEVPVLPIECLVLKDNGDVAAGAQWYEDVSLTNGRSFATAALLDNKIYLVGGRRHCASDVTTCSSSIGTALDELDIFADKTQEPRAALPVARMSPAVVAADGALFLVGGYQLNAISGEKIPVNGEATRYDISSDSWTFDDVLPYDTLSPNIGGDSNIIRMCTSMMFGQRTSVLETLVSGGEFDSMWGRTSQIIHPSLGNEPQCVLIDSHIVAIGSAYISSLGKTAAAASAVAIFFPGFAPAFAITDIKQRGNATAGGWELEIELIARYGGQLGSAASLLILLESPYGMVSTCSDTRIDDIDQQGENTRRYKLACDAPAGIGEAQVLLIAPDVPEQIRTTDINMLVQYASPQVNAIQPIIGSALGGERIRVTGSNFAPTPGIFGVIEQQAVIFFGSAECTDTVWISATEMECISPPGVGGGFPVHVLLAGTSSDPGSTSAMWSFALHKVTGYTGGPFPTAGGGTIYIQGENFGVFDSMPDVRLGNKHCFNAKWLSNEEVQCTVPSGVGTGLVITVSILGRDSAQSVKFEYAAPTVLAVVPSIGNRIAGGDTIVVQGLNFGDDASAVQVQVGSSLAAGVNLISQSQVNFDLPAGTGKNVPVRVVVGGQSPQQAASLSYAAPTVAAISPTFGFNGSLFRGSFSIFGDNFGNTVADVDQVEIGGLVCNSVTRITPTELACNDVPGTFTGSRSVFVSVGGQVSERNTLFLPISGPLVGAIDPVSADGGEQLTIFGSNFGLQRDHIVIITIGSDECVNIDYRSASEVACIIPRSSGGINLDVTLTTIGGLSGVLKRSFSFATSGTVPTQPFNVSGSRPVSASTVSLTWETVRNTSATTAEAAFVLLYSYSPEALTSFTFDQLQGIADMQEIDTIPSTDVQEKETPSPDVQAIRFAVQSAAASVISRSEDMIHTIYSISLNGFEAQPVFLRIVGQNPLNFGTISIMSEPCPETCAQSQYLSTNLPVSDWRCQECPQGAFCGGGRAENIVPLAGWYFFPPGSGDSPDDFSLVRCQNQDACTGYDPNSFTSVADLKGLQGAELCADRYTGNLCHRCEIGTARSGPATCSTCRSNSENVLVLLGGFCLVLVVLAVIIVLNLKAAGQPGRMEVMLAKIVITHLSTISLASSFKLSWPAAADGFFEAADSFATIDSSIISPDCVMNEQVVEESYLGSTYLQRSAVTMILPIVFVAFLALMWLAITGVVNGLQAMGAAQDDTRSDQSSQSAPQISGLPVAARFCQKVSNKLSPTAKAKQGTGQAPKAQTPWWGGDHMESFGVSVIIMLFMAHVTLTRASLSLLTCVEIGNGKRFMLEDLEVECGTSDANRFQYGIGLMGFLVYGLGIPALAFFVLFRRRRSLSKPRNMRVYGFIYSGFKHRWYYWESLVSLRKVGISFAAIFLGQVGPFTQALAAQLILVIAAVIHARARPYTRVLLNNMESLSIGVSLVTFIGGLYLFSEEASSPGLRTLLTTIIIGSNAVFLCLAAYFIIATIMGWHKVHWVGNTLVNEKGEVTAGNTPRHDGTLAGRTQHFMKSIRRIALSVNANMGAAQVEEGEAGDSPESNESSCAEPEAMQLKRASLALGISRGMASTVQVVQPQAEQGTQDVPSRSHSEGSQACAGEQPSAGSASPQGAITSGDTEVRPASTGEVYILEQMEMPSLLAAASGVAKPPECSQPDNPAGESKGSSPTRDVVRIATDVPIVQVGRHGGAGNTSAPPDTPLPHHIIDFAPATSGSLSEASRAAWESKGDE